MGRLRKHSSPPATRCINTSSREKKMPLVVRTEDSEDLPDGWIVEFRSVKSGARAGGTYKVYVSPTGSKFYSKAQISRYLESNLENTKLRQCRSKRTADDMQSTSNVLVVRKDTEEGLPPGWITEIKIRQNGDKIRKDPYYTDPVTGYIFRSKKDVFRYLDSGEIGKHAIKPKKIGDILESTDEKISPPTASKKQKLEGSTTRRQLFEGQSSKSNETSKRKRTLKSSVPEERKPFPKHTSLESDEWPGLGSLALVEDPDSNKAVLALPTVEVSPRKQQQKLEDTGLNKMQGPKLRSRTKIVSASPGKQQKQLEKGVEKVVSSLPTVVVSSKKQQQKPEDADSNKAQGPKLRSGKELVSVLPAAIVSPDKQQLEKGVGKAVSARSTVVASSKKQQQKLEDADSNKTQGPKLRGRKAIVSALPAAGISPEKLQQQLLEKGVEEVVPALPTVVVSPKKQQPKPENGVEKRGNRKTQLSSSKSKDEKHLPHRASKRLAGVNADPVPQLVIRRQKSQMSAVVEDNKQEGLEQSDQGGSAPEGNVTPTASESANAPSEREKTLTKGVDPLGIEEQSNQFEKPPADQAEPAEPHGIDKVNQNLGSSLDMPFGDSWPDPCLEFAFKTLTGAIPVEENLVISDYFQPQLCSVPIQNTSGLALPDTSIDAFCQTDALLRFDSMEKPASPPKFQENTTVFPAATGSGTMLNFGANVTQQPSPGGTNGKDR